MRFKSILIGCLIGGLATSLVAPILVAAQTAVGFAFSVVSISPTPQIKSGEATKQTMVLKNTGTVAWANSGVNAVKIATASPIDRLSGFYSPTWLASNRVVSPAEASVAPGQTAQFSFDLTAATKPGKITEKFGLVMEGVAWAPATFSLVLDIAPATYVAQLTSPAVINLELKAGETQNLSTTFLNTGDAVWQARGASAVTLGTAAPFDHAGILKSAAWASANRVARIEANVPGGSTATINWTVQAPAKPGSYREEFGLVAEGIAWFTPRIVVNLKVVPAIYQVQWVAQSPSLAMAPGDTTELWVDFKNVGNTAWKADGPTPMRLGTARKLDRQSGFYHSTWINQNRAATMTPAVVNPGEVARFSFTIQAPQKIGKYKEYFLPVIDNLTWLNDVGLYWDISVDEELTIQNLLRIGLTATTDPITISGGTFAVRRGSDRSLVRKFDGQPVTINPISGGYSLSTGETVLDTLRIVPVNGAILRVQTSGIGSTYNSFRGIIAIQRSSIGNVWVVNHVDLEDYMKGVAEVPDSWAPQAQQAQMVAARTYAVKKRSESVGSDIFDLYDDTRSQVYYGYNYEVSKPNLTAAVVATKGLIMKYNGTPISAYFFSSSWGSTEASYVVWGKNNPGLSIPYLQAVVDPYSQASEWSFTLTQDYIKSRFDNTLRIAANGPEVIKSLEVLEKFPSGYVKNVRFTLADGRTIDVPYWDFDYLTNNNDIRSMAFDVAPTGNPDRPDFTFRGRGWGHGVGLSQWGAKNMADQGFDFRKILTYYYTGVAIEPL
jgi:stage II sporulation protein D